MGVREKQKISGERAASVKGGRKADIFEQWHHSFGVEALSFYSHVLSLTGTFLGHRVLLLHLLFALVSSFITSAPSQVAWRKQRADGRGMRTWRGFGKQSGERQKFPGNSPTCRALLTTSVCFSLQVYSISYFYFHCCDLESVRLQRLPEELYFLFTGTL